MADIYVIDGAKGINNKAVIASATVTGKFSKRITRPNFPVSLTIASIENKFDDRFDDPSYYYGIGNATIVGG